MYPLAIYILLGFVLELKAQYEKLHSIRKSERKNLDNRKRIHQQLM